MAGYNRIIMIGNLTRDPELKQIASGQSVCRLGIASNRQFKNKQTGTVSQEVCFVDVDVWGAQAESCNQYLRKGRPVLIEGRLRLDTWKDNESGQNRSKHSITAEKVVFLGTATQAEGSAQFEGSGSETTEDNLEFSPTITPATTSTTTSKKSTKAKAAAQEESTAFKDEPPFEDDLPF